MSGANGILYSQEVMNGMGNNMSSISGGKYIAGWRPVFDSLTQRFKGKKEGGTVGGYPWKDLDPKVLKVVVLLLASVALAGLVYSLALLDVADGEAGPGGRDDAPATQVQKDDHQRLGTIVLADTAGSAAAQMAPGLLYRYRASLGPSWRDLILKEAEKKPNLLRKLLIAVLADEDHPFLKEAIQMAGRLEIEEARPLLIGLMQYGPDRVRRDALLAASRIAPLSAAVLTATLRKNIPDVLIAALRLLATRKDRPLREILRLVAHAEPDVCRAAIAAMPARIPDEVEARLREQARESEGTVRVALVSALSRSCGSTDSQEFFNECLDDPELEVRLAALEGLGHIGTKLARPEVIWSRINDPEAPRVERALCLLALERTGSVSNVAVVAIVPLLDPFERYFAARCLIAGGNVFGVEILLDLLETSEDERPRRWRLLELWTNHLMVEVSGLSIKQGLPAWREWYLGLEALQPQTLRPARARRGHLQ